jgi:hypothetical protein
MTTRATTNRMWINPPAVYDVTTPSSHNTTSIIARVQSMTTLLSFWKHHRISRRNFLWKRCAKKKADAAESRVSGLIRVGLLVNGSSGRCLDYPLFSHPRTSICYGSQFILGPTNMTIIGRRIGKVEKIPQSQLCHHHFALRNGLSFQLAN